MQAPPATALPSSRSALRTGRRYEDTFSDTDSEEDTETTAATTRVAFVMRVLSATRMDYDSDASEEHYEFESSPHLVHALSLGAVAASSAPSSQDVMPATVPPLHIIKSSFAQSF